MSLAVLENPAFTLDINKLIHKKVIACENPTAVFFLSSCSVGQDVPQQPSSLPCLSGGQRDLFLFGE